MKHDLEHEERQNKAIRMLAGAIAGLAGSVGRTDVVRVVADVEAALSADEAEPAAPVELEAPKAELHVTPPAEPEPVTVVAATPQASRSVRPSARVDGPHDDDWVAKK